MRNKGFTLIELLAVIVILAIIALIATPIILGIINDSRKSADDETAKLIASNFHVAYQSAYMTGPQAGVEPTLNEIMAKFNMDNITIEPTPSDAVTGEYTITSSSGNVVCTTTTGEGEGRQKVTLSCTVNGEPFDAAKTEITVRAAS